MDGKNPYEFESLVSLMRMNFASIVEKVKGMKVLILDSETSKIISLVYTHSYLLENEVLLTLNIDDGTIFNPDPNVTVDSNLKYLKGIYIVSPNIESLNKISSELKNPHFKEYYVYFTNKVKEDLLELMAKSDTLEIVKGVYEYFVDFYVLDECLFTLNIANLQSLYKDDVNMMLDFSVSKMVNSLFSVCCMLNQIPTVVYRRNNPILQTIANKLQADFNNNNLNLQSIIQSYNNYNSKNPTADHSGCVLLILDRREDCITPLMNQWTYRAMIHEMLKINNNKVMLEDTEYILGNNDDFYGKHLFDEFADVESDLNVLINENKPANSDIYKILESLPEQSKTLNDTTRHVKVLHELSKHIQKNKLLDSGILEQDIATNRRNVINELAEFLNDKTAPTYEKLRVALIFCLKNPGDTNKVNRVKDYLKMNRLDQHVGLVDLCLKLAKFRPVSKTNQDFTLSSLKDKFNKVSLESQSPYLQYKSQLHSTCYNLIKGKLDVELYATMPSAYDLGYTLKHKPASAIVFIVGGATYAEARDCNIVSRATGIPIILGGSHIHNSRSFLADFFNYEATDF
ncbi:hypothetical protein MACK_001939 [Theileria orientalis]|uniref:Vacuolar protein sorting-associated protein 45 n=1 Tax=Theileria orientalis TaxID=68886 RepID=A0A976MDE5_THEOR|nr:hypothetical protein MACK_001939 [Theileria orientalis]